MTESIGNRNWWMVVFFSCLLLILSTNVHVAASAVEAQPSPLAKVQDAVIDLGEVEEGDALTACFVIHNAGKATLHLDNVKTACDCTRVDYPRNIAPDGQGEICLSIDTLGFYGMSRFKAAIYCNDPSNPVIPLRVQARIAPMVTVIPDRVFFKAMAGSELRQEIRIETKGSRPLNVKLVSHDLGEKISVDFVPIAAEKQYRLTVSNRVLTTESYRGRIFLTSDHPGRERIVVPVFAHLTPAVAVYPSSLLLDTGKCPTCREKGFYKGHLIVRAHDRKPLRIVSVGPEQPGLTWTIKAMIPDAAYRLDVRYSSADADKSPPPSAMEIGIDRAEGKVLVVPLGLK